MLQEKDYAKPEYWKESKTDADIEHISASIEYWETFIKEAEKGELWSMKITPAEVESHKTYAKDQLRKLRGQLSYYKRKKKKEDNLDNLTACIAEIMKTCKTQASNTRCIDVAVLMESCEQYPLHNPSILVRHTTHNLKLEGYRIIV